jgi:asparagine synthase (glutamine-hydrolysing)
MCGILGVSGGLKVSLESFNLALDSLKHRGPDDHGTYLDSEIIMGMRRLSIIDIEKNSQPNVSPSGDIVTIFNGEIYNFRELRKNLESLGHTFVTEGDTEVITHLFMEYGKRFISELDGMFAIAIWDKLNRTLILARDRIGKKPLWYSKLNSNLYFSSEIKALLKFGLPKTIRENLIEDTLKIGYSNAPLSPFENIFQLKPGHLLSYSRGNLEIERYWSAESKQLININDVDALEVFKDLFRAAVSKRMLSERPLGVFLSGGVDSSLVASVASEISSNKINTFSVGFENMKFDESPYARKISGIIGTNHHELIVKPDPTILMEDLGRILDQPFADSSIFPTLLLSQFARKKCVVALGGDGGDEVFGGYARYRFLMSLSRIMPMVPKKLIQRLSTRDYSDRNSRILRACSSKSLERCYENLQTLIPENTIRKVINNDVLSSDFTFSEQEIWLDSNFSLLKKMQLDDIYSYLPGDLLYKADMATMSAGIELRSPFLDNKLVEFGLNLPDNLKIRNGTSKWLLKQVLRDYLTEDLINRPKKGFGIPRSDWLRTEFNEVCRDLLLGETTRNRGWFKVNEIHKILKIHEEGSNRDSTLWPLMVLELWARNWIDETVT